MSIYGRWLALAVVAIALWLYVSTYARHVTAAPYAATKHNAAVPQSYDYACQWRDDLSAGEGEYQPRVPTAFLPAYWLDRQLRFWMWTDWVLPPHATAAIPFVSLLHWRILEAISALGLLALLACYGLILVTVLGSLPNECSLLVAVLPVFIPPLTFAHALAFWEDCKVQFWFCFVAAAIWLGPLVMMGYAMLRMSAFKR